MRLCEAKTWGEDLARAAASIPEGAPVPGTYLVTGASGLIGSALVELLLHLRDQCGKGIVVVAAGRSPERLATRFGKRDGLEFLEYDAMRPLAFDKNADFIVHAASNASPELYVSDPCGTLEANILGTREILKFARSARTNKVLYVSSSEVYGVRRRPGPAAEDDYGSVNPLLVRSSYAEGKRAAEAICAAYASQYGVKACVVRPGHIYGPTATASDKRVSSVFPRLAARGEALVLKSAGLQRRSYCHCLDCATAILAILAAGKTAEAYNVSNPSSVITIREMAELVAEAGNVPLRCAEPTKDEKAAFNPMDDSSLNSERLLALGWHPAFDARGGFTRTVATLKEFSPQ